MRDKIYDFSERFIIDSVKVGDVFSANGFWNKIVSIKRVIHHYNLIRIEGRAKKILDPYSSNATIVRVDK